MQFLRRTGLFLLLLFACRAGFAQTVPDTSLNAGVVSDSLADRKETELAERTRVSPLLPTEGSAIVKKGVYEPKPKKSALYSAIFPGLGQLNNHEYWKVPVVFAGVGVAAYFLVDNTKQYRRYRKAYVERISNPNYKDEFTDIYSQYSNETVLSTLQSYQDQYKKWLDMTYLYSAVGYILQVVDALAFAHLKNFDISQNLSFRMQPVAQPDYIGLGLVVRWK